MSRLQRWIEVGGAIGLVVAFAVVQAVGQPRGRPPAAVPDNADTPPPAGTARGENFSAKPPAQLFAADCTGAGCHRGPQGLAKGQSAFGLTSFLRQHYTNSQQSAAALASYLAGIPGDNRAPTTAKKQPEPKSRAAVEPDTSPKQPAEKKQPPATAKLPPRGKQATVEPTPAPATAATPTPTPAETPAAAPAPPPPPPPKTFDIFD